MTNHKIQQHDTGYAALPPNGPAQQSIHAEEAFTTTRLGRLAIRTGQQRTITVTPVTVPEYCKAAHGLADSAHAVGVPGVLLAASAGVGCADHPLVVQRVYFERLPWSDACNGSACQWACGYRRVWSVKWRAIADLLEMGFGALAVDGDWLFRASPHPLLTIEPEFAGSLTKPWYGSDIVVLNIGRLRIRATARAAALSRRVANRSSVAWDQVVFNEEVSHSAATCCWGGTLFDKILRADPNVHKGYDTVKKPGHSRLWGLLDSCFGSAEHYALQPPSTSSSSFPDSWNSGRLNRHMRVRSRCVDPALKCRPPVNHTL